MSLLLTTLREPTDDHAVEVLSIGFLILPQPGREDQFNDLARRAIAHTGPYAAFGRRGDDGRYEAVHILPEDDDRPQAQS